MDKKKIYVKPVVIVLRMKTTGMMLAGSDEVQAKDDQFTEEAESKQNTFVDWEEHDSWE